MARKRKSFWTIDAETDPFHNCQDPDCYKCHGGGRIPIPFIWGLYNGDSDRYEEFHSGPELQRFLEELEQASGGTLFYAHNGGKFDYHYLRDAINSDEPILIINGRLSKFKIGEHEFRDSLNIFPNTRLKDFGIKSDIDYEKMEATVRHLHMPEISAYLRQDCVGLWEVIQKYRQQYGKQLTQAGASMKMWQKMSGIEAPRQTKTQYDELKDYYYGGRVQCIAHGVATTDFEVYDINSAYPFAMLHQHPLSATANVSKRLPKKDSDIGPTLIRLNCISTGGALPLRGKHDLYFPADEGTIREYTITGWEYLAALEIGTIKKIDILEVQEFKQLTDFKNYIEHFFEKREQCRKNGDVAGRTFGKYFMNSLYGKFGANCENYSDYVIASVDSRAEWEDKDYKIYKPWGDRYLMNRNPTEDELDDIQGKWRYYNIATAASVTGFVRAYLYRALASADGPLYCDTDSIAARGFKNLRQGTELGAWKHEMTCDSYAIAGKKLYAFHEKGKPLEYDPDSEKDKHWKIASKGVNFAARKDAPSLISSIAHGSTYTHNPDVPTYTVTRDQPTFIPRMIRSTYKDMSKVPSIVV